MATKVNDQSAAFMSGNAIPIEDLGGGISRQILGYGPDLMVVRVWFEQGAVGQIHHHPHSQATYIESGRFTAHVDGEARDLGPGDCVYVAPHLKHGLVCLEPGAVIDTFSPVRADFLSDGN